jgi:hypothetical protein
MRAMISDLFLLVVAVAMHREKDELHDSPYRRDFLTYDNHVLDGEFFLQVRTNTSYSIRHV